MSEVANFVERKYEKSSKGVLTSGGGACYNGYWAGRFVSTCGFSRF